MPDEDQIAAAAPVATAAVPSVTEPSTDAAAIVAPDVHPISQPTIPAAAPAAAEPVAASLPIHDKIEAIKAHHIANSGMSAEIVAIVTKMIDEIKALVGKVEADL